MLKILFALIPLFLSIQDVHADVIEQIITLPMTVDYDSNPSLSTLNKQSVERATVTPRYKVTSGDGIKTMSADFALLISRSSNQRVSLNREDPSLSLAFQSELPNGSLTLNANYAQTSTRISELVDTGLVQVDGTTRSKSFNGNYSHAFSDKLDLSLNGGYSRVNYSGGSLTSYTLPSASVALNYSYNEFLVPFVQASFSHYQPVSIGDVSDSTTIVTGANWKVTDRFNLGFNIGVNQVSAKTDRSNQVGGMNLSYLTELSIITASLTRSVTPSGNGGFLESDQFQAGISRELTNKSAIGSDVSIRQTKGLTPSDFSQLSLFYRYDILPNWNMRLNAQLKELKNANNETASGSLVGFTVSYTTPSF